MILRHRILHYHQQHSRPLVLPTITTHPRPRLLLRLLPQLSIPLPRRAELFLPVSLCCAEYPSLSTPCHDLKLKLSKSRQQILQRLFRGHLLRHRRQIWHLHPRTILLVEPSRRLLMSKSLRRLRRLRRHSRHTNITPK